MPEFGRSEIHEEPIKREKLSEATQETLAAD